MVESIVIIDDDADDIGLMVDAIKEISSTCSYRSFLNPIEAIEYLRYADHAPDLIIVDLTMPYLSGLQCIDEIRSMAHLNVAVVALHSSAIPAVNVMQHLQTQSVLFFLKPFSYEELRGMMSSLLCGKGQTTIL
jgi:CheY-like chemotaxis protein